ncbi:HalOD1 output domain-containing protein [Halosolutus gelatinilyticus]|uniref:HalOD1 output domain-containing protein n=1 Tax=Halosolutus gelatinilyticus TaxID=2931975 RepID=UPI001FF47A0F|nr:HalOD1 output domain-containing protein [Halosolutus gelatinilyticus]
MTATQTEYGGTGIDPETETAIVSHDWDGDESLSATIVSTIAGLSETDPADVDRLYDRIDPDSLETIFEPTNGTSRRNGGQLSFQLDAYSITVHATGAVVVTRSD